METTAAMRMPRKNKITKPKPIMMGRKAIHQAILIYPRPFMTTNTIVSSPKNPIPPLDADAVALGVLYAAILFTFRYVGAPDGFEPPYLSLLTL